MNKEAIDKLREIMKNNNEVLECSDDEIEERILEAVEFLDGIINDK